MILIYKREAKLNYVWYHSFTAADMDSIREAFNEEYGAENYIVTSNETAIKSLETKDIVDGELVEASAETLAARKQAETEIKATQVRIERNRLLAETDKYMTVDYPITEQQRTALTAYRQALRELPQQEGFPYNVTFPEPITL